MFRWPYSRGVAGSKPKSLTQQLFETQQRRAAHKAALEKAAMQAEQKEKRAAARREEAAARQAQRAAEDLARRQQAADARQVQQVLREMEKRETLRQQAQAREQKDRTAQQLRDQAAARTREVERRVQAIGSVLTDRDRGLEPLREESNAALESGDAEPYAERIAQLLEERSFLRRSHPDVAYSPDSRRLTVAVDLPRPEGVPAEKAFRYAAAQDEIVAVPRQHPVRIIAHEERDRRNARRHNPPRALR